MQKGWTSRERVQAALAHQEPDRVPIGMRIAGPAYQRLRQYLGFPPGEEDPPHGSPARIDPDLAGFLGLDMAWLFLNQPAAPPPGAGGHFVDAWGIGRRIRTEGPRTPWVETMHAPLAGARMEDLRDFAWPDPRAPEWTRGLEVYARSLYEGTALALAGSFGGPILQTAEDLRGRAQWQADLSENPDFACALLNRIARVQIGLDEAGIQAAGRYLSIVALPETSDGPPDPLSFHHSIWQETLRPVLERRWRAARQAMNRFAPHARLALYAAAPPLDLFQHLVDGGVDLFGPLGPGSIEPRMLKHRFGNRISLFGGVDGGALLHHGSENDVRAQVIALLEQMRPGGGFLLTPDQTVQAGARPQNIVALCETVRMYGRYAA